MLREFCAAAFPFPTDIYWHVPYISVICNVDLEPCQCKEEVEIEEAQALVAAMERSSLTQDRLPHIPGLSRELSEKKVDIHVQDEVRTVVWLFQLFLI